MLEMTGSITPEGSARVLPAGEDGFPPFDASRERPASLAECYSLADRLDYLCGRVQGSYLRSRTAGGDVLLRLKTADGDVLSATKATTTDAVAHLLERAGVTE